MDGIAADGRDLIVFSNRGQWRVRWHPPPTAPPGTPHGAAAICVSDDRVVLVSRDGRRWGLPGGRPDPGDDWADTMVREVREEACAQVTASRLLGFTRGVCVHGFQQGLVLVRSLWRAEVRLERWQPRFEMTHRRLVPAGEVMEVMAVERDMRPIYRRMFAEAGLAHNPSPPGAGDLT